MNNIGEASTAEIDTMMIGQQAVALQQMGAGWV
jgi:hypothetical protein